MPFSIRQVRYFVSTAELGQISQAARQLNITQSAITAAIRELESRLDTTLFQRLPHGMALTEAGKYFLNHCYDILNSVDACTQIRYWDNDVSGQLTVAASYTVMGYFLPYHMQRLSKLYPHLQIRLLEWPREQIESALLTHEIDVAVLLSSNVDNPALVVRPIHQSQRQLWVASGHELLQQTEVGLAEVAQQPYIMLTVDEAEQTAWRYWRALGQEPQVYLRTSSVEAVRSMVANGSGVAILSDMVYRPWSLEGRRITTIPLSQAIPPMTLGLAWAQDEHTVSPAKQVFCDYFIHYAHQHQKTL